MRSEADRFKELYDVEKHVMAVDGGVLVEDPYPGLAELRAQAPVHEGSARELLGLPPGGLSLRPEAPVYAALSFEANDRVLRENELFSSTFYAGLTTLMFGKSILEMVGDEHRRNRALVQPAFSPKRSQWWIDTVDRVARRRGGVGVRGPRQRRAQRRAVRPDPAADDHVELRTHPRGGARLPRGRGRGRHDRRHGRAHGALRADDGIARAGHRRSAGSIRRTT